MREWEREPNRERSPIPTSYIQFLEGRLQVKFIFDVPKESNFPYILKAFDKYLLNKWIDESNLSINQWNTPSKSCFKVEVSLSPINSEITF